MTEKKTPNIYQRISAIQKEVTTVAKDADVQGSYTAVTHDAVTRMLRPLMVKHGVVSVIAPQDFSVVKTGVMWGKRELMQIQAYFSVTYRNVDNPDDCVVMWVHAFADDNGDKGPGKVMSYAQKYADLKMFRIATGEDDEARVADDQLREKVVPMTDDDINELFLKAEELFGDDAGTQLKALADKIFPYTGGDYTKIAKKHKDSAIMWLGNKADALADK